MDRRSMFAATLLMPLVWVVPDARAQSPHSETDGCAAVDASHILVDTVQKRDLVLEVRGPAIVKSPELVEIMFPLNLGERVKPGQRAFVLASGPGDYQATVARVRREAGNVIAELLIRRSPQPLVVGARVEATVTVGLLRNVLEVGWPANSQPESFSMVFKVDVDGRHAVRARARFGRNSINRIEVRSGLIPGDQIVVSDTSALRNCDRIALQ